MNTRCCVLTLLITLQGTLLLLSSCNNGDIDGFEKNRARQQPVILFDKSEDFRFVLSQDPVLEDISDAVFVGHLDDKAYPAIKLALAQADAGGAGERRSVVYDKLLDDYVLPSKGYTDLRDQTQIDYDQSQRVLHIAGAWQQGPQPSLLLIAGLQAKNAAYFSPIALVIEAPSAEVRGSLLAKHKSEACPEPTFQDSTIPTGTSAVSLNIAIAGIRVDAEKQTNKRSIVVLYNPNDRNASLQDASIAQNTSATILYAFADGDVLRAREAIEVPIVGFSTPPSERGLETLLLLRNGVEILDRVAFNPAAIAPEAGLSRLCPGDDTLR